MWRLVQFLFVAFSLVFSTTSNAVTEDGVRETVKHFFEELQNPRPAVSYLGGDGYEVWGSMTFEANTLAFSMGACESWRCIHLSISDGSGDEHHISLQGQVLGVCFDQPNCSLLTRQDWDRYFRIGIIFGGHFSRGVDDYLRTQIAMDKIQLFEKEMEHPAGQWEMHVGMYDPLPVDLDTFFWDQGLHTVKIEALIPDKGDGDFNLYIDDVHFALQDGVCVTGCSALSADEWSALSAKTRKFIRDQFRRR